MGQRVTDVDELIGFKDALARLVSDPEVFKKAAEAFEHDKPEVFRDVLEKLGIFRFCWMVCRWFCVKVRGYVCVSLCPEPPKREMPTVAEMLEFGNAVLLVMKEEKDFRALFEAYEQFNVERFQAILKKYRVTRFCYQFCSWFSNVYCVAKCHLFCPPRAKITSPVNLACVQPVVRKLDDEVILGVEIWGVASGGVPFVDYKLEYSVDGLTWRQDAAGSGDMIVVYPDGHRGGVYTVPVGPPPGVLGYLESDNLHAGVFWLRLTVSGGGGTACDTSQFQLHVKSVLIDEVGRIAVQVVGSTKKLVLDGIERAVGGYATIGGSAYVDGCGHRYKKYKLMLADGWVVPAPGLDYATIGPPWAIMQSVSGNSIEIDYTGKTTWFPGCVDNTPQGDLTVKWDKKVCGFPPWIVHVDRLLWDPWITSTAIPMRTGKFTVLVAVEDDASPPNTYADYLQLWLDNIPVEAELDSIGIPGKKAGKCEPLSIEEIIKSGGVLEIRGTAWDNEIITGDLTEPSLNFDHFEVVWKKDCDQIYHYDGIQLYPKPPPPPPPAPGTVRIKNGVLAEWDIADLVKKGIIEPCAYIVQLRVWDRSRVHDHTVHYAQKELAFTLVA